MSRASTPACATNCSTGEIFYTLREAQIVIESWRRHYNTIRPHAALGYSRPRRRCSYLPSHRGLGGVPVLGIGYVA